MIITMQTPSMKKVLQDNLSGLQTDTVEGVIHELDFDGEVGLDFTSAFDKILQKWVPILVSIMFGKRKPCFTRHWKILFDSYDITTWTNFEKAFPGITMDWSDAQSTSLIDALVEYSNGQITEREANSFIRKCDVHFKRSLLRVIRNGRIVENEEERHYFCHLVNQMTSSETSPNEFEKICKSITHLFPNAINWLRWHLLCKRATSFFPACQDFNEKEMLRWFNLSSNTNAQENLGGQFEKLFMTANQKLTINEAALFTFKFMSQFDADRAARKQGLSTSYSQYPRSPRINSKKEKNIKMMVDPQTQMPNCSVKKTK